MDASESRAMPQQDKQMIGLELQSLSTACSASQVLAHDCAFRLDGVCDAGMYCNLGTDCCDCDPCRVLDGASCAECVAAMALDMPNDTVCVWALAQGAAGRGVRCGDGLSLVRNARTGR
jgi:hypothetical protein